MRVIIAGVGNVGYHLAKLLCEEGQDIVLIDKAAEKLKQAANQVDAGTIRGNSTSYSVLEEAGVSEADLLIAVTNSEDANIATAIIAKHLGAKRTVARISNTEFLYKKDKLNLKHLGIDDIISPESLAAREIKRLLKEVAITDSFEFQKGLLQLMGVNIDAKSPLKGKTMLDVAKLNPDQTFMTVAILRDNETIIPYGNTHFEENDHAYFIAQPEGVEKLLFLSGKKKEGVKSIMILGGSRVGFHAARLLSARYNVKIIERDAQKCFELADQLPDAMVINGDGRNMELLEEENIQDIDAFIAVTGDSETNIITCLVAKKAGVKKTIAMVENMDYIHLSQSIGVDTMINKKLIAANFIFRHIRQGEIHSITSIHGVDAEILEFEVQEDSKITQHQLRNLQFPKSAIIGGVIRDGHGLTTPGDFRFQPKDRVVVLSKKECIKKVEDYFI
ncbi:Trk system potassium transporter TrkA [Roseivirga pacifica]|uniref:Trk system potassium transporter TrkA n=1 Tax=Roseivirga pacifica TaxID=1267423 RepID=UPI0020947366|nr:Trk system potassium transporter TrkA [Roseivirga pacifica]MCO6357390.1 Trk system potassium transporter TrkA [Roseivirga pacifica]MCO6367896.1 Trk system potassium transporter TrkA [Roseivirga pacifica]MCO6369622.1 Trk system potassium transporter TrkA [Roseivirga pacifica]MCO6373476.1 Trk system potassium transporter TrkA [Roseivirga pacifica]MCO6377267.1 Trk system potassium transporter TrkA [Roseivirga pacifica]